MMTCYENICVHIQNACQAIAHLPMDGSDLYPDREGCHDEDRGALWLQLFCEDKADDE